MSAIQVSGLRPLTGGGGRPSLFATRFSLSSVGYVADELVLEGTARRYDPVATPGDGHWLVEPGDEASYRTRLVVFRPVDAGRADGTVVVEWLNVSGGIEVCPLWMNAHTEIIRRGAVYIGVSAQELGITGGADLLGARISGGLRKEDPNRYGTLSHPGDPWSYDIFSGAGSALRQDDGALLGGIGPRTLLAGGHSQSAYRLITYINAIDGAHGVYDGFLVLGRGAAAASLGDETLRTIGNGPAVRFRNDLRVPVLCVESETDVAVLGFVAARQPDEPLLRTWEIAGAAHTDTYQLLASPTDDGRRPVSELVAGIEPTADPYGIACSAPINSGMQQHYVTNAAVAALDTWARIGLVPASPPLLEVVTTGEHDTGVRPAFAVDGDGIARGGIRTPFVDAPTATLSGLGQDGRTFGRLFGTTRVFDRRGLLGRYGTEAAYRLAVEQSAGPPVDAGFLLEADVAEAHQIAVEQWRRRTSG
jgi:hypothetical protein